MCVGMLVPLKSMLNWSYSHVILVKNCLARRLVDKMLHEPRSSIRPSWVGVGKHAPCRPPSPPVLILVQTGVMQHFVISPRLSLRTPATSILNLGEKGGKDCTSGPKTDKIDATFRPPTVAPNALLQFCEVGDKGRDDRIARIGRGKGTRRRND